MKLYFMGICGTAMGNVALMLKQMGYEVCGTDTNRYPPMSTVLEQSGIDLFEGYDPDRLAKLRPDLVVVGNVISRGNSEIEWLLETRLIEYISLPALLNRLVLSKRNNIVITGTHGKTTSTAITAFLLKQAGFDPGYLIGGVPQDLPTGSHLGSALAPFVIEGDEYDTAFFDKRSKFIHYQPHILVVNNMEFDHGDIFRDLIDIKRTFLHVARLVPRNGYIIINGDDEHCMELASLIDWVKVIKVGVGSHNDVRIDRFIERETVSFDIIFKDQLWESIGWRHHALFNARNATMAAVACAYATSPDNPIAFSLKGLSLFRGVKRRQECLHACKRYTVLEDFGHHPTALEHTLKSIKLRYPEHHIIACFEPRSNTAVSNHFQEAFTESLSLANTVFLGPVHTKAKTIKKLDTVSMSRILQSNGVCAEAFDCHEKLLYDLKHYIVQKTEKPHVICFFSNGAFGNVHHRLVEWMQTQLGT